MCYSGDPGFATVLVIGDSIPYGVGSTIPGGWRKTVYDLAVTAANPFWFVGPTQQPAGGVGFSDPYCYCVPGTTVNTLNGQIGPITKTASASITIFDAGTNDIASDGVSAATAVSRISTALDLCWDNRLKTSGPVVLCTILLRNDAFDTVVTAANALLPAMIAGKSYAANVTLLDQNLANLQPADYSGGAVHPNDLGVAKLAPVIWTALSPLVRGVKAS